MAADLFKSGQQFQVPVFVIQGTEDDFTPAAISRAYVERLTAPRKEFLAIEGAGHMAIISRADEFLRLLLVHVRPLVTAISTESLTGIDILILGGPGGWGSPEDSLRDDEVKSLVEWVRAGGSFLLICDHLPAPRNAAKVAAALGITEWHNGAVNVAIRDSPLVGPIIFWRAEYFPAGEPAIVPTKPTGWKGYQGTDAILVRHRITEGRNSSERVRSVATFVGSVFQVPSGWEGLLTMPKRAISLAPPPTPDARLVFTKETPRISVGGWLQGAVRKMGKGRVGTFGDTALFSAGPASDNRQFVLNVMHWLSRIL